MGTLNRDDRDAVEAGDRKFRRACDIVQEQYDDRWPARGTANVRTREWSPLDAVSRQRRLVPYRRYPDESR